MIFTPFVIPLLVSAGILIWLAYYALRFKEVPTARIFSLVMVLAAFWSLNQALEISTTSLDLKILMVQVRVAANAFLTPAELALVLAYIGRIAWLNRTRLGLLLIMPFVFCFLSLTSNLHKFFRYDFRLDTTEPLPVLIKTNAFGYWIFIAYSSVLILTALGLLLAALRDKTLSVRNTLILFFACLLPFVVNLLFNMGITPIYNYDLGPTSFVITGILYAWALLRYQLFRSVPQARHLALENISDLLIVLDNQDHIMDFNRAAGAACDLTPRSIGTSTDDLSPAWSAFFLRFQPSSAFKGEVSIGSRNEQRTYDLNITPIRAEDNHLQGRLFLLHDLTERTQAETALRESEERFRMLADNAPLAMSLSDLETGEVLYANPRLVELFEMAGELLLGSPASNLYINSHDRQRFLTLLQAQRQVTDFEVRLKKGDGREFWASLTSNLSTFGGRAAIHTTCIDITQRKQAEEALQRAKERLDLAVRAAEIGVWDYDVHKDELVWDKQVYKLFGVNKADFSSANEAWLKGVHPADIARIDALTEHALHHTGQYESEFRVIHPDGSIHYLKSYGKVVLDADCKPLRLTGTNYDITERMLAEEALQRANERLDLAVRAAQIGVWDWDVQKNILTWDDQVYKLYGVNKADFSGTHEAWLNCVHPDDAAISNELNQLALRGEREYDAEFRVVQPDGSIHNIKSIAKVIRDADGTALRMTGVNYDITQRKLAEEALQRANERLDLAVHTAQMGVWDWDIQKNEVIWDEQMYQLYGLKKEDFSGAYEAWLKGIHPDDAAHSNEMSELARRGEKEYDTEFRVVHPDGSIHHIKANGVVIRAADGTALRMTGVNYDITQRRQAEEAIQRANERLDLAVHAAQMGVWDWDVQKDELVWDEQMYKLYGVDKADFSGAYEAWLNGLHPDDAVRSDESVELALSGEREFDLEFRVVHPDGSIHHIKAYAQVVRDADGNPLRLTGVNYDITQRKMAEEELIDSEKRFRTLFEQAAVGVAILETKTGHYVRINQKYCDFLGYTIEEMLNKRFQDVTFLEDTSTNVDNNTLLVAGKIQEFTIEKRYLRRDGKIVWGNLTASPLWLPGENPPVYYHIAVVQDITDRKRAEEELINIQKIAATLAAGVAHELNSPLQVITGYSDSLALEIKKEGKLEGERPLRQLDTINRNAWRVAEIVRSLKYYAHPDHEAVRETNLNNLVQDALTLLKPQIKNEAYIEIETELAEDIPPCKCEANKIMQVLINLLNNAYDAMPYGGKVTIQTAYQQDSHRLVLKVADTGRGIPEAIRSRIFDPFFTTKPVGKGVGLGLSIVQSIVRAHGGEIEVESARGKGAIFTVYVPLEPPESAAGGAESQADNPPVARYD